MSVETGIEDVNKDLHDEFKYTDEELAEIQALDNLNKNSDELKTLDNDDPDNQNKEDNFELDDETLDQLFQPNEDPEEKNQVPGEKTDTPAEINKDPEQQQPEPEPELPDYTEQLEEIEQRRIEAQGNVDDTLAKLNELAEQFDDGEIAQGKYDIEKQKLDRQLRGFDRALEKVESDKESLQAEADSKVGAYQEKAQAAWQQELIGFLQNPANEMIAGNVNIANHFDQILAQMGGAGVFNGLSNQQILQTVRDRLALSYPELPKYTAQAPAPEKKPAKPTNTAKIPVSLSQTPAIESPQDDPFAHIRKLSGVDYEEALGKLSSSQLDQFLYG